CLVLSCVADVDAAAPPARERLSPDGARLRLGAPSGRFTYVTRRPPDAPFVFSRAHQLLAMQGPGNATDVYDTRTDRRVTRLQVPDGEYDELSPVAFSHDGKSLAVVDRYDVRSVWLWPLQSGAQPKKLHLTDRDDRVVGPLSAAFLPGDRQLAT